MKDQSKVERPYQLIFPDAGAYHVDDILNFICSVEFPDDHLVKNNAEARNEFRVYLTERLLKAVVEGKFELWDLYLSKVVAPPVKDTINSTKVLEDSKKQSPINAFWRFLTETFSPPEPSFIKASSKPPVVPQTFRPQHYRENFWWTKMTSILKPDLVKFCQGERFSVIFEGDENQPDERMSRPATATELESENQESIIPPAAVQPEQKPVTSGEEVLTDSKLPSAKPEGKSKPVGKAKIADQSLKGFDDLPDSGHVDVKVVAALFGCSVPTVWRRVRSGQLVDPHKLGERTTRWKVGELRAALKKGSSLPDAEKPAQVAPHPAPGSSMGNKAKRTKLADNGTVAPANATEPADISQNSTDDQRASEPHASSITHSTKQRRNELDSVIDEALQITGNDNPTEVFMALKEMALQSTLPFTGIIKGDKLLYTTLKNTEGTLTRNGVSSRIKTRRKNASKLKR